MPISNRCLKWEKNKHCGDNCKVQTGFVTGCNKSRDRSLSHCRSHAQEKDPSHYLSATSRAIPEEGGPSPHYCHYLGELLGKAKGQSKAIITVGSQLRHIGCTGETSGMKIPTQQ